MPQIGYGVFQVLPDRRSVA